MDVIYFNLLFRKLYGGAEENHEAHKDNSLQS